MSVYLPKSQEFCYFDGNEYSIEWNCTTYTAKLLSELDEIVWDNYIPF